MINITLVHISSSCPSFIYGQYHTSPYPALTIPHIWSIYITLVHISSHYPPYMVNITPVHISSHYSPYMVNITTVHISSHYSPGMATMCTPTVSTKHINSKQERWVVAYCLEINWCNHTGQTEGGLSWWFDGYTLVKQKVAFPGDLVDTHLSNRRCLSWWFGGYTLVKQKVPFLVIWWIHAGQTEGDFLGDLVDTPWSNRRWLSWWFDVITLVKQKVPFLVIWWIHTGQTEGGLSWWFVIARRMVLASHSCQDGNLVKAPSGQVNPTQTRLARPSCHQLIVTRDAKEGIKLKMSFTIDKNDPGKLSPAYGQHSTIEGWIG